MTKRDLYHELESLASPKIAYLLGYLWGDGNINKQFNTTNGCGHSYRVALCVQKEDGLKLLPLFEGMDFVRVREPNPRDNRKQAMTFTIHCKEIYEWLAEHGYAAKSWESAEKILEKIPETLRPYWFRGLIDADGHVCFRLQTLSKKLGKAWMTAGISIYSGIDQDWGYLARLCDKLRIKHRVETRTRPQTDGGVHRSSEFCMTKRPDVIAFGDYIWKDRETDGIGLERKWRKFQGIKEYDRQSRNRLF